MRKLNYFILIFCFLISAIAIIIGIKFYNEEIDKTKEISKDEVSVSTLAASKLLLNISANIENYIVLIKDMVSFIDDENDKRILCQSMIKNSDITSRIYILESNNECTEITSDSVESCSEDFEDNTILNYFTITDNKYLVMFSNLNNQWDANIKRSDHYMLIALPIYKNNNEVDKVIMLELDLHTLGKRLQIKESGSKQKYYRQKKFYLATLDSKIIAGPSSAVIGEKIMNIFPQKNITIMDYIRENDFNIAFYYTDKGYPFYSTVLKQYCFTRTLLLFGVMKTSERIDSINSLIMKMLILVVFLIFILIIVFFVIIRDDRMLYKLNRKIEKLEVYIDDHTKNKDISIIEDSEYFKKIRDEADKLKE